MRLLPLALLFALPGYAAAAETPVAPTRHRLKPEAAAALKAALPSYAPPPPSASAAAESTAEELPGGIVRLPEYFVTEEKIRQFSEYEMLTPKGKIELARKLHPGLGLGPFSGLNNGIGLAMLAEEEKIRTRRRAAELVEVSALSHSSTDQSLQDALRQIQLRPQN